MRKNHRGRKLARRVVVWAASLACLLLSVGCRGGGLGGGGARPRTFADVPSERLAFRFEPDVTEPPVAASAAPEKSEAVQRDFDIRRADDALLRTVQSPDGSRVLALYAAADTLEGQFRIDLYTGDGQFLRNYMPANLTGDFASTVAWSPDGQALAFIAHGNRPATSARSTSVSPEPTASPDAEAPAMTTTVPAFGTEQIYIGDRDGFIVRPLTTRDGLIYFYFAWAPDGHAVAALASKENEWNEREAQDKPPAGRPRLIFTNGGERLLDDRLTDVLPVWSPDGSKVATAFETDVSIYDASLTSAPTGGRIALGDTLLAASVAYEARNKANDSAANAVSNSSKGGAASTNGNAARGNAPAGGGSSSPLSFNPVVRLQWPQANTLFVQTGFVRIYKGGDVRSNYMRWHVIRLSPQAKAIK